MIFNFFEKRVSDYCKASVKTNGAPSRKSESAGSSSSVTTELEPATSKPFSLDEDFKWSHFQPVYLSLLLASAVKELTTPLTGREWKRRGWQAQW